MKKQTKTTYKTSRTVKQEPINFIVDSNLSKGKIFYNLKT